MDGYVLKSNAFRGVAVEETVKMTLHKYTEETKEIPRKKDIA